MWMLHPVSSKQHGSAPSHEMMTRSITQPMVADPCATEAASAPNHERIPATASAKGPISPPAAKAAPSIVEAVKDGAGLVSTALSAIYFQHRPNETSGGPSSAQYSHPRSPSSCAAHLVPVVPSLLEIQFRRFGSHHLSAGRALLCEQAPS